ncbi:hypothetical protein N2152v2_009304 [Parachlorella kessleri]
MEAEARLIDLEEAVAQLIDATHAAQLSVEAFLGNPPDDTGAAVLWSEAAQRVFGGGSRGTYLVQVMRSSNVEAGLRLLAQSLEGSSAGLSFRHLNPPSLLKSAWSPVHHVTNMIRCPGGLAGQDFALPDYGGVDAARGHTGFFVAHSLLVMPYLSDLTARIAAAGVIAQGLGWVGYSSPEAEAAISHVWQSCGHCAPWYWPDEALRLFNQKAFFYYQLMLTNVSTKDVEKFRHLASDADKGGPEAAAWARALYELALADAEADLLDRYPSESLIPGFDDEELPVLPARPPAVAAFCRPPPAGPPRARAADDGASSGEGEDGGRLMWLMRGLEGVPLGFGKREEAEVEAALASLHGAPPAAPAYAADVQKPAMKGLLAQVAAAPAPLVPRPPGTVPRTMANGTLVNGSSLLAPPSHGRLAASAKGAAVLGSTWVTAPGTGGMAATGTSSSILRSTSLPSAPSNGAMTAPSTGAAPFGSSLLASARIASLAAAADNTAVHGSRWPAVHAAGSEMGPAAAPAAYHGPPMPWTPPATLLQPAAPRSVNHSDMAVQSGAVAAGSTLGPRQGSFSTRDAQSPADAGHAQTMTASEQLPCPPPMFPRASSMAAQHPQQELMQQQQQRDAWQAHQQQHDVAQGHLGQPLQHARSLPQEHSLQAGAYAPAQPWTPLYSRARLGFAPPGTQAAAPVEDPATAQALPQGLAALGQLPPLPFSSTQEESPKPPPKPARRCVIM